MQGCTAMEKATAAAAAVSGGRRVERCGCPAATSTTGGVSLPAAAAGGVQCGGELVGQQTAV